MRYNIALKTEFTDSPNGVSILFGIETNNDTLTIDVRVLVLDDTSDKVIYDLVMSYPYECVYYKK